MRRADWPPSQAVQTRGYVPTGGGHQHCPQALLSVGSGPAPVQKVAGLGVGQKWPGHRQHCASQVRPSHLLREESACGRCWATTRAPPIQAPPLRPPSPAEQPQPACRRPQPSVPYQHSCAGALGEERQTRPLSRPLAAYNTQFANDTPQWVTGPPVTVPTNIHIAPHFPETGAPVCWLPPSPGASDAAKREETAAQESHEPGRSVFPASLSGARSWTAGVHSMPTKSWPRLTTPSWTVRSPSHCVLALQRRSLGPLPSGIPGTYVDGHGLGFEDTHINTH